MCVGCMSGWVSVTIGLVLDEGRVDVGKGVSQPSLAPLN
jgi:hypothetical protein